MPDTNNINLKKGRKVLESDITKMTTMSEKCADEAEAKRGKTSRSILVKSNALRYSAKQKKGRAPASRQIN